MSADTIKINLLLGLSLILAAPLYFVCADTITLVNGDRLSGRLSVQQGKRLKIATDLVGEVSIDWSNVQSIQLDNPAFLQFDNGESFSVLAVEIANEQLVYTAAADSQQHTLQAGGITGFSSEAWLQNKQGVWSGNVNLSLKSERGNDNSEFIDLDFNVRFRRKDDRWRIKGEWDRDIELENPGNESRTSSDKWSLVTSYDYFFSKKQYLTSILAFESNASADIDLRAAVGPMYGYQFYESKPRNMLAEVGFILLDQNYHDSDDSTIFRPSWRFEFDQYILENHLQFYHEQLGALDTESGLSLRTMTGLRLPVKRAALISLEIKLDYDDDPVNDNETTDTTTRLKFGYKW